MARDVRMIDPTEHFRGGPDFRAVETGYSRRFAGRESLVFILILALAAIWLYRNNGVGAFDRTIRFGSPVDGETSTVEIKRPPVLSPAGIADLQSDVIGQARVAAERVNLRTGPGFQYEVVSVLPEYWEVAILRQLHISNDGETWVEVMAQTDRGWQRGWLNRRYLESSYHPDF